MRDGSITKAARVYGGLRSDIISGGLKPGAPIRIANLARSYSVSMTVAREALTKLAEHNLAVLTPNQGFRVVSISRGDLAELTELRITLEGQALERSIVNGDVRWEARVVSAHHLLERTAPFRDDGPGTMEEWSEAHFGFHDALVSACGGRRLLALTRSLRDSAELYRQLSGASAHGHGRDVAGEHRELMELAIGRRAGEARAALGRHLQRTTDDLLSAGIGASAERTGRESGTAGL